ncbi:hypothetical protein JL721_4525 [Aureococcus anophagefferens]|nr:hypothetical protein JL721_4525 [Aureococcus anophagefferens]
MADDDDDAPPPPPRARAATTGDRRPPPPPPRSRAATVSAPPEAPPEPLPARRKSAFDGPTPAPGDRLAAHSLDRVAKAEQLRIHVAALMARVEGKEAENARAACAALKRVHLFHPPDGTNPEDGAFALFGGLELPKRSRDKICGAGDLCGALRLLREEVEEAQRPLPLPGDPRRRASLATRTAAKRDFDEGTKRFEAARDADLERLREAELGCARLRREGRQQLRDLRLAETRVVRAREKKRLMDVTEIRDADAFGWFQAQKCAEAHLRRRDQRERGFQHELQEAMERADALELRMDALCDERHDAAFRDALASLVEATVDPKGLGAVAAAELADATRALGAAAVARRESRRDCAKVEAELAAVKEEDLRVAKAHHDAADLEARVLARERQLSRERMARFRAKEREDHALFAQFEFELRCECEKFDRMYEQLRADAKMVKVRAKDAAGGGLAGAEARRLHALRGGGAPGDTSVLCSKLGVPIPLAQLAELDRKRELERKLRAIVPGPDDPKTKQKEADHAAALKSAFSATDAVVKRLRASLVDRMEATDVDRVELDRLHVAPGDWMRIYA